MFDSFIITFREGFEMALVVSLLLAATKGTTDSKKWILGELGLALLSHLRLVLWLYLVISFRVLFKIKLLIF